MSNLWKINKILNEVYAARQANNPRYSIRAFARDLDINDSALAKILKNKRTVGPRLSKALEKKLNIPLTGHAQKSKRVNLQKRYVDLSLEKLQPLPAYSFALLEFLKINSSKERILSLTKDLNISAKDLKATLDQFVLLGWVEETETHYELLVKKGRGFLSPPMTNENARDLQKTILDSSKSAIENIDFSKRIHNSLFFRIDEEQMQQIRNCVEEFCAKITKISNQLNTNPTSVYCMQVGTFPVISENN